MRRLIPALLILSLAGCAPSDRERAAANSAATVWEAADAIEKGVQPLGPVRVIKANALAAIRAAGFGYAPAERDPNTVIPQEVTP